MECIRIMVMFLKQGGQWKQFTPYVKQGGYTRAKQAYTKVNGVWRLIHNYNIEPNDYVLEVSEGFTISIPTNNVNIPITYQFIGEPPVQVTVNRNNPLTVTRSGKFILRGMVHNRLEIKGISQSTSRVTIFKFPATLNPTFTLWDHLTIKRNTFPYISGSSGSSRAFNNINNIEFEDSTDFLKNCQDLPLFRNVNNIINLGPQDVSHITSFGGFLGRSRGTVDFTGWIWPSKASYGYFAEFFTGTLIGLENLPTENLIATDLENFLYIAQLTPKIDLRQWCVPSIPGRPDGFGYYDGYTSTSVGFYPIWGTCTTRSVYVPSSVLTGSSTYSSSFTVTGGDTYYFSVPKSSRGVTLTSFPDLPFANISKLYITFAYSFKDQSLYTYGMVGDARLTVTYSSGRVAGARIYTTGRYNYSTTAGLEVGTTISDLRYASYIGGQHDFSPTVDETIVSIRFEYTGYLEYTGGDFRFNAGIGSILVTKK